MVQAASLMNQQQDARRELGSLAPGFTLVELLVTISVLALLAGLLLPSLSRTAARARATDCRNNLKQLQLGWLLYAHDNNDLLPPDRATRHEFDMIGVKGSWVLGNPKVDHTDAHVRDGVLYAQVNSVRVYRCPADRSTVQDSPSMLRTRSYSMDLWLGAEIDSGTAADEVNGADLNLKKLSHVEVNESSRIWVFIDEHEQSIDDGAFNIGNKAFAPDAPPFWVSLPADRHENGANLSFADGHVSHQRWRARRLVQTNHGDKIPITNEDDRADLTVLQDGLPNHP